jgi:hypothetical protein
MSSNRKRVSLEHYEKLGAFYLGRPYELTSGTVSPDWLLYDSKDLTTHAVCVGMTGSGKTGLCVSLLEEAAIDGIPAIAIDPKGDLGNLMLTFPHLRPEDFRPWIDPAEAAQSGATVEEHATTVATRWRDGLAEWGQDGARIERLRAAVDVAIYTPGGSAGLPLGVLRSFDAPSAVLAADALGERVASTASGLLALLGMAADPLKSREHILVSHLLTRSWEAGEGLDLQGLIRQIQAPPFERLGAVDLESFYPLRERAEFAMSVNALLAAPSFSAWLEGEPLDISRLLWTREGKPRISILSIAHLSETERMFFVTLLLGEVVSWMRAQPGTPSLRALLFMDEVAGYLPPSAKPPSKPPFLTLLKQARAYGLGVVLATQNPVDIDYKALSNAGTWFLGRLQTERDKARVLDGLEGAFQDQGRGLDRASLERALSGLGRRVFLMNNVHERGPIAFQTRWALSYLRGPLTSAQIEGLMASRRGEEAVATREPPVSAPEKSSESTPDGGPVGNAERPVVPDAIPEFFLPLPESAPGATRHYHPMLLGVAELHYVHARLGVDEWETASELVRLKSGTRGMVWKQAEALAFGPPVLLEDPEADATFSELPTAAARAASYKTWSKQLASHFYQTRTRSAWQCKRLDLRSTPEEDEAAFRARVGLVSREARDLEIERLRQRYEVRMARERERVRAAEQRVGSEESQLGYQKTQAVISAGASVFSAIFGRKLKSVSNVSRATTAVRSASRVARDQEDVGRAKKRLSDAEKKLHALEADFAAAMQKLAQNVATNAAEVVLIEVRPRKADIAVQQVALVWAP